MDFGEIVEPSTRAFIYEEDEFCVQESLEWKENYSANPKIGTILIAETKFLSKIVSHVLLEDKSPVLQTLNGVIKIYEFTTDQFIILLNPTLKSSLGQITEKLRPFFNASECCYCITTMPTATHQNKATTEKQGDTIRMLSTDNGLKQLYPTLEIPNLITGVGASCLSYSVFNNKNCSLFVAFTDYAQIDSLNSEPLMDLLKSIGYMPRSKYTSKPIDMLPEHNLYM